MTKGDDMSKGKEKEIETGMNDKVLSQLSKRTGARTGGGRGGGRNERECYYCHEKGHMKFECPQSRNPPLRPSQWRSAQVASTSNELSGTLDEEEIKWIQEHRAFKSSSPSANIAKSGISCLTQSTSSAWLIDSGASDHMTGKYGMLSNFKLISHPPVRLADGSSSPVGGSGHVKLTSHMHLDNVLYMPKFPFNLLSVSQITKSLNCSLTFYPDRCVFQDLVTRKTIGTGHISEGCYWMDEVSTGIAAMSASTPMDLHCRLGHPSLPNLKKMCPELSAVTEVSCESCQLGKHIRASYPNRVNNRSDRLFSLIHSDVWGPCPVESRGGFKYFVTFIDDFSRATWLFLIKSRSEVFSVFKMFCAEIENQFNMKIKILRSDNAKEYFNHEFTSFMSQHGILHESSCPYTPQQNGVAERKNRHLLEVGRTLMLHRQVPHRYWGDAVLTATHLINRMPSTVLNGETPFSVVYPTANPFPLPPKIFGCVCFVHNNAPTRSKLDARSIRCIFLGYSKSQKGYRCYSPVLKQGFTSADVTFVESSSYFTSRPMVCLHDENAVSLDDSGHISDDADDGYQFLTYSVPPLANAGPSEEAIPGDGSSIQFPSPQNERVSVVPSEAGPPSPLPGEPSDLDIPIALRKGKRHVKSTYATHASSPFSISQSLSYDNLSSSHIAFVSTLDTHHIPRNVSEALSHPGWCSAMQEEMLALKQNGTWDLVLLPSGKHTVGCKWVYTVKVNADGSVARLKARLVAKGYSQAYGIDYEETFSPVAKMTSVRLCISLAARFHWPLHQLDVKNAFLNGILEEEVYMEQPPGFIVQEESQKVCRLRRSLYGLKQSPRAWFGRFTQVITQWGLHRSAHDHSMFYRQQNGMRIIMVVYVDDIVITGDDEAGIRDLKMYIGKQFQTKDLGRLKYFLGIEVARSKKDGISLSQRKYVLDLLTESGMLDCRPSTTPMDPNSKLFPDHGDLLEDPGVYRRLVGKLNYLTVTRPDISYAVSVVSQFMQSPRSSHLDAVMRILRYLKGSPGRGLIFTDGGHSRVVGFSDADWAGCPTTRRSTTGYCVFVGGNLISWKSKKQHVVSRSSAESEYRAMADLTCEMMWVKYVLRELGLFPQGLMRLYSDSQSAIHMAENAVLHERTKHIEVDCHVVRDKVGGTPYETPQIEARYVSTERQLADILTKPLVGPRVRYISDKLGMLDIYAPT